MPTPPGPLHPPQLSQVSRLTQAVRQRAAHAVKAEPPRRQFAQYGEEGVGKLARQPTAAAAEACVGTNLPKSLC